MAVSRTSVLSVLSVLSSLALAAEPEAAKPTLGAKPPEGAVVLFDGTDTSRWTRGKIEDGCLLSGAMTKDTFGDCVLHLEFKIEPPPEGKRTSGNSGVYIQRRYEIQILNTHGQRPSRGGCGAIYQVTPPDVNAAKPPGEWQTYDITFHAPRWEGDKKVKNARISVVHNGIRIHNDVEVPRKTGSGRPEGPEPGPLYLQHHGAKVYFRNIWLLPLTRQAATEEENSGWAH